MRLSKKMRLEYHTHSVESDITDHGKGHARAHLVMSFDVADLEAELLELADALESEGSAHADTLRKLVGGDLCAVEDAVPEYSGHHADEIMRDNKVKSDVPEVGA